MVLVHQDKRRTVHQLIGTGPGRESLGKRCLARTQLPPQEQDIARRGQAAERRADPSRRLDIVAV
jgi:hypothetical protein